LQTNGILFVGTWQLPYFIKHFRFGFESLTLESALSKKSWQVEVRREGGMPMLKDKTYLHQVLEALHLFQVPMLLLVLLLFQGLHMTLLLQGDKLVRRNTPYGSMSLKNKGRDQSQRLLGEGMLFGFVIFATLSTRVPTIRLKAIYWAFLVDLDHVK
jgi:hypothetical protein